MKNKINLYKNNYEIRGINNLPDRFVTYDNKLLASYCNQLTKIKYERICFIL